MTDFEELIDDVANAASDAATSLEWGSIGRSHAERELKEARATLLAEIEKLQRPWIPVSQEPEKNTVEAWEMYEVILGHPYNCVAAMAYEGGDWLTQSRYPFTKYVTHYRPLPELEEET